MISSKVLPLLLLSLSPLIMGHPSKSRPKSIPHHAAHILSDPNHSAPRLVTSHTAHGGPAVLHHGEHRQFHPHHNPHHHLPQAQPLIHRDDFNTHHFNDHRPPYNNQDHHIFNQYNDPYPHDDYHNRDYHNRDYHYPGLNQYGGSGGRHPYYGTGSPYGALNVGGSYYIRLPDGRVEDAATVAAQLGYVPQSYNGPILPY